MDTSRSLVQSVLVTESPLPPFIRQADGLLFEGHAVQPPPGVLDRVVGQDLTFVRVDHQTRLQFGDFEIVIEGPFRVTTSDGTDHRLDAALRASLGPVLDLFPDSLIAATVEADASLRLRLASGATLDVPADFEFEAWQVNGPGGFLVVCATGGEGLALWGSSEE
ncbi:MAG: DUF6188 family protein [Acidimicrobiia bacterium]